MTRMTRRVFIAGGAATAALAAGQLDRSAIAQQPPGRGGVLNLYSARHYSTDNAIYQNFTDQTGIRINLVEADADQLIERIRSEGANTPADVLITVDAGRLWRADQQGLFERVNSRTLNQAIPASLRDPEGQWFGFSRRARVIMYNKERVNPATLSTYEDLVNARWRGKILVRTSSHVYNQSLTGSIIQAAGPRAAESWARGLVANFARPPEGNDTAQIRALAAGQGDLAIVNTYYLPRLAKSNNPEEQAVAQKVGVFFPNQRNRGTHVNISGGGVLKTSRNKAAAIRFLEHLVSRQSQDIFARSNNEYPVVAGVSLDPVLASYGTFRADAMNAATYGRLNPQALQIMDRAGWR